MYEQYTDKQIVEMLVPKLEKAVPGGYWDEAIKRPELNRKFIKAVATIYRSAYIRGQLGRSFIIGKPKQTKSKQTERWVPATKDNIKVGSKVRYLNAEKHERNPEFYPAQGTVGEVDSSGQVRWAGYETAWFASWPDLEVLVCE